MKQSKSLLIIAMLLLSAMFLGACGGGPEQTEQQAEAPVEAAETTEEEATEESPTDTADEATDDEATAAETSATLVIWADGRRISVLETFVDEFAESVGVEIVLQQVMIPDMMEQVRVAIPAGEGPDIFVVPHDSLGLLVEGGLIAPVDLGAKADKIAPRALQAFTYDSELYALPYATESVVLFRNTDLVSEPVTTWDEMLEVGSALMEEGVVENVTIFPTNGYHIIGLHTGYGGYIFGQDEDGNYLADDVGLDNPGFIASGEWIQSAVDDGYIPATIDYATADTLFAEGALPFILNGPWALESYREAGVNYAVDPIPAGDAGPGSPFLGAQGFVVNAQGDNPLLAETFLTELIATDEVMDAFQAQDPRIPAWLSTLEAEDDPDLVNFGIAGETALPMPSIPQMGAVWGSWGDAVQLIMNGEDVTESLTNGANQIREAIASE